MKVHYKGVLCNLATYRVMGEDKPALYYIDSPDQETMLKGDFLCRLIHSLNLFLVKHFKQRVFDIAHN